MELAWLLSGPTARVGVQVSDQLLQQGNCGGRAEKGELVLGERYGGCVGGGVLVSFGGLE